MPMQRVRVAIAVLGLAIAFAARSTDVRAELPAPVTDIAGYPVQCRDYRGQSVSMLKVVNLGDLASAFVVQRVPIIAMDTHLMDRLPDKLLIFFYQHECAHHALGHWYVRPPDAENQADCWAVQRSRDLGLLSRSEIVSFAPFLAQSHGTPWGHLPGPQRIAHMLQCFDQPPGG